MNFKFAMNARMSILISIIFYKKMNIILKYKTERGLSKIYTYLLNTLQVKSIINTKLLDVH